MIVHFPLSISNNVCLIKLWLQINILILSSVFNIEVILCVFLFGCCCFLFVLFLLLLLFCLLLLFFLLLFFCGFFFVGGGGGLGVVLVLTSYKEAVFIDHMFYSLRSSVCYSL